MIRFEYSLSRISSAVRVTGARAAEKPVTIAALAAERALHQTGDSMIARFARFYMMFARR